MTLEQSFAHCRRVAKTRARNFYYSFVLLSREQKDAMCAVYAFMRYADDISDEGDQSAETRTAALNNWRGVLVSVLSGDVCDDPVLPAFQATVERYKIPHKYFFDLIEGVASDLDPQRYETFEQLYRYCYRVASVVGLTVVHVYGFSDPRALELAEKCGIGFQLTNILRDIPEDAGMGRVYLPDEDLNRFGIAREQLMAGKEPPSELMAFEWQRAQSYYHEAAPLLGLVQPASRPALWAMMAIYYGILLRIKSQGYDVYRQRPRLTALQKAWIVMRAARTRWFGGALPFPG